MGEGAANKAAGNQGEGAAGPQIVYFSSATGNTKRFVERVGFPSKRIPLRRNDPEVEVTEPYVLFVPTYGGGNLKGAVPKQVIKFLNVKENRDLCRGVISSGNTNFGEAYCLAGNIVSQKLKVPHLYKYELLGTPTDVERVRTGLTKFWETL